MPLNGILKKEKHHDKVPKLYLRSRVPLLLLHLQEEQLKPVRGTHSVPRPHPMPATELNTILNHRKVFLGFVERRIADRAVAEDILQAAYMRALAAPKKKPWSHGAANWSRPSSPRRKPKTSSAPAWFAFSTPSGPITRS